MVSMAIIASMSTIACLSVSRHGHSVEAMKRASFQPPFMLSPGAAVRPARRRRPDIPR
jgi:hypothetical protein